MSARDFNELPPLEALTDAALVIQQAKQTVAPSRSADAPSDIAAKLQAINVYAQINLLPIEEGTGARGNLPWWTPLACAAVVAALALGSSLPLRSSMAARQVQVLALEAQLQQKTGELAAAKAAPSGTVAEQSQALQAAVTQQERVLAQLGGTVMVGAAEGAGAGALIDPSAVRVLGLPFSVLLEALSRTRVEGLWLTQVRIDKRSQEFKIEGQARDAQMVSGYIDALSRNPPLKGLVVSAVEVTRPAALVATALATPSTAATATVPATTPDSPAAEPARFKLALAAKASSVLTPAAAKTSP